MYSVLQVVFVSLVSFLFTAHLVALYHACGSIDVSVTYYRKFVAVGYFRVIAFGGLVLLQLGASVARLVEHRGFDAVDTGQLLVATAWMLTWVLTLGKWKYRTGLKLVSSLLLCLVDVLLLIGMDVLVTRGNFDVEHIVRIAVHGAALLLLLALLVVEVIVQQHRLLTTSQEEFEPLLASTADEEAGRKFFAAPNSQLGMALHAFRYVWPTNTPLKVRLMACFVLVALERGVNLAVPVLNKNMINTLSQVSMQTFSDQTLSLESLPGLLRDATASFSFWAVFYPWVFGYLAFYFLRGGSGEEGLLANVRDLLWIPITQAAFRRISLDVFAHLLALDHNYHIHRKTGQIMRILDRGTSSIQDTVSIVLFNVIPQLVDIGVACTYLGFKMQPWVALIVLVTVSSYIPLTIIITERRGVIRKKMNALDNERESRATDMLLNYETVKYFCNEKFELKGYDMATRQYQSAEYWQMVFLSTLSMVQSTVVWVGLASGLVVCTLGVARGELTVGDAVLFITMMNQLYVPLTFFGSYYRQVQKALIDMENMFQLLATEPSVKDPPRAGTLEVREGKLTFEHVTFSYHIHQPVLKDVSLEVPGGSTLAVVGATGSGKSTILRLLLRFYDPQEGTIFIDNQAIDKVTQLSLRRAIAVVPQDTVLFNDTVGYNIKYAKPGCSDEEMVEAARIAHIDQKIISFPAGYHTRVGERGLRLSGGEKQRVAFARAILKQPHILILDEATSALDSLTERMIQSSLQSMRGCCTTVIVAHRLSTIMEADKIVVLEKGVVAECGSHIELLEKRGLYSAMWSRQLETVDSFQDLSVICAQQEEEDQVKSGASDRTERYLRSLRYQSTRSRTDERCMSTLSSTMTSPRDTQGEEQESPGEDERRHSCAHPGSKYAQTGPSSKVLFETPQCMTLNSDLEEEDSSSGDTNLQEDMVEEHVREVNGGPTMQENGVLRDSKEDGHG